MSMRKLYTAGALAAAVLTLAGCGASAAASRATPSGEPEAPTEAPTKVVTKVPSGIPSALKSKFKSLVPVTPSIKSPMTPPMGSPMSPMSPPMSPMTPPMSPGPGGVAPVPPMATPEPTTTSTEEQGEGACETLATAQAKQAAEAIEVPTSADEARRTLDELTQMGLYRPDLVAYSDDPIEAVKQVKERLEYGLITTDGELAPKVKEMLKTPQPTG
jgi:hypothetical protein